PRRNPRKPQKKKLAGCRSVTNVHTFVVGVAAWRECPAAAFGTIVDAGRGRQNRRAAAGVSRSSGIGTTRISARKSLEAVPAALPHGGAVSTCRCVSVVP